VRTEGKSVILGDLSKGLRVERRLLANEDVQIAQKK
jgi:hypothetical protein